MAYNAPHAPLDVPPTELYPGEVHEEDSDVVKCNAILQAMDHELGRLLDSMTPEQRDSTLVVFLGDNGTPGHAIEPPRLTWQGKGTLFEGGTNVPLILAGPGVPEGREPPALAHGVDLFATMAELAGVTPTAVIDGLSLLPVMEEPEGEGPRQLVYTEVMSPSGFGPYDKDLAAFTDGKVKIMQVSRFEEWSVISLEGRNVDGRPRPRASSQGRIVRAMMS